MRVQDSSVVFDAPIEDVWAVLHPKVATDARTDPDHPRVIEHGRIRIEVVAEGDEHGDGLVRHCWFPVPRYMGGQGESWELVSQVRPPEFARYDSVARPPWLRCRGWHRLEDLADGRTRVRFHEEYEVRNRLLRVLLEKRLQRFNTRVNETGLEGVVNDGLRRLAARRDAGADS
jgi:hypothetical protein